MFAKLLSALLHSSRDAHPCSSASNRRFAWATARLRMQRMRKRATDFLCKPLQAAGGSLPCDANLDGNERLVPVSTTRTPNSAHANGISQSLFYGRHVEQRLVGRCSRRKPCETGFRLWMGDPIERQASQHFAFPHAAAEMDDEPQGLGAAVRMHSRAALMFCRTHRPACFGSTPDLTSHFSILTVLVSRQSINNQDSSKIADHFEIQV
ncbi:hypothetical protein IWZ01DRAFT_337747 [Phyllosticta capitalensis]